MSTVQYRLPGNWQTRFSTLEADLSGTFTVTAGSADETALLMAGAMLVVGGKEAQQSQSIVGANGATLVAGDVLRVAASSTGTPGSGTAVQGVAGLDATGKVPTAQLPADTDVTPPTIKEAGGTALIAGDVLKGSSATTGTPGSGTAVVGFMELDANGLAKPLQATTVGAPPYVLGALYFDTTLNKLRVGGATAWETVTSA